MRPNATNGPGRFSSTRRRPNFWLIAAAVFVHLVIFYVLIRALAPDAVQSVERSVVSSFTVTVTAPEEPPPPEPEVQQAEGVQGDPGAQAIPRPVTAPSPQEPIQQPRPIPRASSTGIAAIAGAAEDGTGTGAAGTGLGAGSGSGGNGRGGGIAVRPSVRSGELDTATDFPAPPEGRQSRFGKSVTVGFIVGVDGIARDCAVISSSVDTETARRVCPLVIAKIRFNPATRANGSAAEARYGYRVDFKAR